VTAVLVALLLVAFAVSRASARRWQAKVGARLRTAAKPAKAQEVVLAQVDGRTYRLGQLDQIRRIHVGAAPGNTIQVSGATIAPRHLRLCGGKGCLFLRNLADTPVVVDGIEVRPRGRRRLLLPTQVKLTEKVTIVFTSSRNGTRLLKE